MFSCCCSLFDTTRTSRFWNENMGNSLTSLSWLSYIKKVPTTDTLIDKMHYVVCTRNCITYVKRILHRRIHGQQLPKTKDGFDFSGWLNPLSNRILSVAISDFDIRHVAFLFTHKEREYLNVLWYIYNDNLFTICPVLDSNFVMKSLNLLR